MADSRLIDIDGGQVKLNISKSDLESCIHCGLCLPACPTYLATGREMESPRGRIFLLSQAQQNNELTARSREHVESCLGCLGCQTACPSGVHYESILDQARPALAASRSALTRFVMRFSFQRLLPDYKLLRGLGALMRWAQARRLDQLALQWASKIPGLAYLAGWQLFTPAVPVHKMLPGQSWRPGPKSGRALFFSGCVMDIFYNHVNHAAMRLLVRQGKMVEVPPQTCCGALAYHAGEIDIAEALARRNIELFAGSDDPIVVTSAGCGAMLKHYGQWLGGEAEQFSARVQDISETLYQGQNTGQDCHAQGNESKHKYVYHAACHLAHAQGVRKEPQALLENMAHSRSEQVASLQEAEHCCGSAGIYNLMNTPMSLKVLERKMKFIEDCGADTIVTGNPGCLLQLEAGARLYGLNVKVKHLAEVLDEA